MSATKRKRVLVTGAGRGLGRVIAERLASRDWEVWAVDKTPILEKPHPACECRVLDVTDESSVAAIFAEMNRAGGVDGLVNNAGIFPLGTWDGLDIAVWRKVLEVNLIGSYICARDAGKSMRDHGRGGSIVNIASVTYHVGLPNGIMYTSSKGGVVAMTRSLAKALGRMSIRVNCVSPGLMDTEGVREHRNVEGVDRSRLVEQDPLRLTPGSTQTRGVADVVAYLLSDDASEITGQTMVASGGTYLL